MIKKNINSIKIYLQKYFSNDISILATNLTYIMLITIFPFFAIFLGVLKGFGLDNKLITYLKGYLSQNEVILTYILDVANKLIESSKSSILTGMGAILLVLSVIKMLDMLELTFNDIWNVKKRRKYSSRIISYIAIIFTLPLAITLIFATSSYILEILGKLFGEISILTLIIIKLFNIFLNLLVVFILFIILPNKTVRIFPAFIGSLITVIGMYILYNIFVFLNQSISNYNVIYGSLAFVPIFLIWIRFFWTIILIGAQITYALQTSKELVFEKIDLSINFKKNISIYLLYIIIKRFEEDENPYSFKEIEVKTNLPSNVIIETLKVLQNISLVNEISTDKETYYQINRNPNNISFEECVRLIEVYDKTDENIYYDNMNEESKIELEKIMKEINIKNDKLLKDI